MSAHQIRLRTLKSMSQDEPPSIDYAQITQATGSPVAHWIVRCFVILTALCDLGKAAVLIDFFYSFPTNSTDFKDFSIGCLIFIGGGSAITLVLCLLGLLSSFIGGVTSKNGILFRHRLIFFLHAAADLCVVVALQHGGDRILWKFILFIKSI
jgi:hypothetical protein